MPEQTPTIGRIVQYRLNANDAAQINRRRTTGASVATRMQFGEGPPWPEGAQAHIGNDVTEGEVYPMVVVRTWGPYSDSAVNGQVLLDGTDVLWVTSVSVGDGPGTFSWPPRV